MSTPAPSPAASPTRSWVVAAAGILVAAALVPMVTAGLDYRGSSGFHSGLELVGALIGAATAFALLVRYLAWGERFELVTGLAFAVNAVADLVHGGIPLFDTAGAAAPGLAQFIPATYVAGRLAMALLLVVAVLATPRTLADRGERRREAVLAGVVAVLATALLVLLVDASDLPNAVHPDWLVPRPLDAVTALVFAAAFVLLANEHVHAGRGGGFVVWVAAATGIAVVGQTTMAFSATLYGPRFDVAHALKILSYLVPLVAFIASQVRALAAEQAVTERLREADLMREQFVRTVTHELRTPLVVITGFTEALAGGSLTPEEQGDYLERVQRNTRTLHRLIEEVLRFGEFAPGDVRPERIDVARHLRQLVDQLAPVLGSHEVVVASDGEAPALVDGHALDRVATNLLMNAVRYAPAGTTVAVTVGRHPDRVEVTVADEGPGVPASERELIFEPFYRGSGAATLQHRGSGIGLAVVRQLVALAGGAVDVRDADGGGACFVVTLPAA